MLSNFDSDLAELKSSPLFNLSLCGKELFHSNFLAWLFNSYHELLTDVLVPSFDVPRASLCLAPSTKVHRERAKTDISCTLVGGHLIIENKVKALADKEQLDRYRNNAPKQNGKELFLLLLALSDADLRMTREANGWSGLTYGELADRLGSASHHVTDPYHRMLLADYVKMVGALSRFASHVPRFWSTPAQSDGLESLSWKRQAAHALAEFEASLRFPELKIDRQTSVMKQNPGTLNPYVGFTRGTGLFGFIYMMSKKVRPQGLSQSCCIGAGVQVQADTFKVYLEFAVDPISAKRAKLREIADKIFADPPSGVWRPLLVSTKLNTYNETYFYVSEKLHEPPIDELAERLARIASSVMQPEFERQLLDRLQRLGVIVESSDRRDLA